MGLDNIGWSDVMYISNRPSTFVKSAISSLLEVEVLVLARWGKVKNWIFWDFFWFFIKKLLKRVEILTNPATNSQSDRKNVNFQKSYEIGRAHV